MPEVDLRTEWTVRFTNDEFILVLRALGSRMKGEAEAAKAKDLGDRLAVQRATMTDSRLKQNAKFIENLRDAGLDVPLEE